MKPKTEIIVYHDGGVIDSVISSQDVSITFLDSDINDLDDEQEARIVTVTDENDTYYPIVFEESGDPEKVERILTAIQQSRNDGGDDANI